jgi:hypothetical protein
LVRQFLLRRHYTITTVLLIIMLGSILPSCNSGRWAGLGIRAASVSEKIQGLLDSTEPVADNPDIAYRANNLVPSSNNGFVDPRQDPPPVWERTSATKRVGLVVGFFFAIRVISLFFIFYRNSRNSSGNDEDSLTGVEPPFFCYSVQMMLRCCNNL